MSASDKASEYWVQFKVLHLQKDVNQLEEALRNATEILKTSLAKSEGIGAAESKEDWN